MGLAESQFTNTNDNFTVTFSVTDGELKITPLAVTVTITGNKDTKTYNGEEQKVEGYTVSISDPLYKESDFTFSGTAVAKGTDKGTYPMGLKEDQFTNNNDNFTATFQVTDGQLTITAVGEVVVTITGNKDTKTYNGEEQKVEGYTVDISDPLYTEADFTFSGTAVAKGTDVDTYPMGLAEDQFTNNNTNFDKVTFVVNDGELKITKLAVTVSIEGNTDTKVYNGEEQKVEDYKVTISDPLYKESDFTFSGTAVAKGTNVGDYPMGLAESQFANTNDNFDVTFSVTDGKLTITPVTDKVTVTITEHSGSETYDGTEKTVTGYDVSIDNTLYKESDFTFSGDATVKGTDAGSYPMELTADDFTNNSANFTNVVFEIVDGTLEIAKLPVTVTIKGNTDTKVYNGEEQKVEGYTATFSDPLYSEAYYTFSGTDVAKGTDVNEYPMGLAEDQFTNTNDNFDVTFSVTDGKLTITPITDKVTVTITEHSGDFKYDAAEHEVKGYDVTSISNELYKESDFTFSGDATVKGTDAGSYDMEIAADDFTNNSVNFTNVEFVIVDGTLEIAKRDVDLTSATAEKVYDGTALTNDTVTVGKDGWATGEGATYTVTGTQTDAGSSPNAFEYTLNDGTKAANYNIRKIVGTLTVTPYTKAITVTITGKKAEGTYNGTEQKVEGYDVTISDSLYTEDDFTFSGTAVAARTHVVEGKDTDGQTDMGLTKDQFTNTSKNFTNVTFVVTDGYVKVTPATLTIETSSAEKKYDGTELTSKDYTIDGLQNGETVDVEIVGSQTLVGSSPNGFKLTWAQGEVSEFLKSFMAPLLRAVTGPTAIKSDYTVNATLGKLTVTDGTDDDPVDPDDVMTKTHEDGTYKLGDKVEFTLTAKNIYDAVKTITFIEIEGVEIEQATFENVQPGATVTTKATYTVTEDDILAGGFTNELNVKIGDKQFGPVEDDVTVEDPNGHLTVTKTTTSTAPKDGYGLGDVIEYKIVVTNDGNLTITDITVTDELTGDEWTVKSLAPGESETFTASYTVTEDDILAGNVENVATATGTSPDPDKPEPDVTPGTTDDPTEEKNAHLTVTKTVTSDVPKEGVSKGDKISYEITVENDGNLTITDIKVTDDLTGDEWAVEKLAPGESETFTAEYTVTDNDVKAGKVVNTATATGTDPEGNEPDVTPGTTETPIKGETPKTEPAKQMPATGDNTPIVAIEAMAGFAAALFAGGFILRRRREDEQL